MHACVSQWVSDLVAPSELWTLHFTSQWFWWEKRREREIGESLFRNCGSFQAPCVVRHVQPMEYGRQRLCIILVRSKLLFSLNGCFVHNIIYIVQQQLTYYLWTKRLKKWFIFHLKSIYIECRDSSNNFVSCRLKISWFLTTWILRQKIECASERY